MSATPLDQPRGRRAHRTHVLSARMDYFLWTPRWPSEGSSSSAGHVNKLGERTEAGSKWGTAHWGGWPGLVRGNKTHQAGRNGTHTWKGRQNWGSEGPSDFWTSPSGGEAWEHHLAKPGLVSPAQDKLWLPSISFTFNSIHVLWPW